MRTISKDAVKQLTLQSQWLQCKHLQSKEDALKTIEHLGYVQIDTISVVERAHHHTLWSRINDYQHSWLHELLNEKKIFEYWSHAASYLPMKDFRFSLPRKKEWSNGKTHWFVADDKIKREVLRRIKREGPLQSKDFEAPNEERRTWYYWKPAKRALEQLFMEGKLMVSHRQGFQKVFDLTENVLPADVETAFPAKKEYAAYLVMNAIRSFGIVSHGEICYMRAPWKEEVKKSLRRMLKEKSIEEVKLEGHEIPFYTTAENLQNLNSAEPSSSAHILSPFDNLLIQRKRTHQLFHFNFTIECYLPAHKRIFGYFPLPVLFGNEFVARLDPKADRAAQTFYIKNFAFEENVVAHDEMLHALAEKIKAFASFNHCDKIILEKVNRKKEGIALKKLLK